MQNSTKKCPGCGLVLSLDDYSPGNSRCRKCKAAWATARYNGDPEYRKRVRAERRADQARRRADPVQNAKFLAKAREKYRTNAEFRERQKRNARLIRAKMVGRDLAIQAKTRSNRNGREYSLDPAAIQSAWEQNQTCGYCGVALAQSNAMFCDTSPTLDRIDPRRGYVPENVIIACFRCNSMKRDATADEIEALAANFRRVSAARRI